MKKQLLLIILLILQAFAVFIPSNGIVSAAENPEGYIIEGDSVVWENDWARLEVYPHTSHNILTHVQYANLTWKLADNDIDVAFRFDSAISNGKIWKKSGDDWIPVSMYLTEYGGKYYYRHNNFHVVQDGFYQFKWQYSMPVNTSGKWELLGKLSSDTIQEAYSGGRYVMLDPWWDSSWSYSRTLTISNTYIIADLTNFPVLVNVSAVISAKCDSGNSIRFLNIDNSTEYYYEIEGTWNAASYNFVWVNITSVSSSSDTKFLLYYNNSGASDNQDAANVWNSNYIMVQHLNETSGSHLDSTSNDNDLDDNNIAGQGTATGIAGKCDDFDYTAPDYSIDTAGSTAAQNLHTLSIWVNSDDLYGTQTPYGGVGHFIYLYTDGRVYGSGNTFYGGPGNVSAGTWYNFVLTCDGTNAEMFIDAVSKGTAAFTVDWDYPTYVGAVGATHTSPFEGRIDEIRISNVVRNDSWINATFDSINQTLGFLTIGSEVATVLLLTEINTTTGIELTNATLNGYIYGNGTGSYNYGFWIGTSTPVTEGNADRNMTGIGTVTITGNSDFSHNDSNLSKGTHYCVKSWVKNATDFVSSVNEDDFWTKCDVPTGLTATASGCNVDLAWTKGTGAANTVVMRQIRDYSSWPSDGTEVYNGTGSSYSDTTASGSTQYYRAWSWAGDKLSDENASTNVSVPPCPPTSVTGSILVNNTLKISWTAGTGANTTLIVRKAGSTPTSVTDGTVIYNGTGAYTITSDFTENWYFRLWSYANQTYSSSAAFAYGALSVNCYDEETNASLYFDVFVSNQSGSQTYESKNNTNPHTVNVTDLPIDDKVSIRVSAASNYSNKIETFTGYNTAENATVTYVILLQEPESKAKTNVTCKNTSSWADNYPAFTLDADVITILAGAADEFNRITVNYTHYEYESRTYYRDLTTNHIFVLNAYLPSAEDKQGYLIRVIDEIDQSIDDAYVLIKRNVNGSWVDIASDYTDGNGYISLYLVPDIIYKFVISKTGYVTEYADWTPLPSETGHTFQLEHTEPDYEPEIPTDVITITAERTGATLYVNYTDDLSETEDINILVYEFNYSTGNVTLLDTYTTTDDSTITEEFTVNSSNAYYIVIHFNHSSFGHLIWSGYVETDTTGVTTPTVGDTLFDLNYGTNPFGWSNFLMFCFITACFFSFDEKGAGVSLIICGGLLLFINYVIGFNTTLTTIAGGGIPVLFVVIGIMIISSDKSRRTT